MMTDDQFSLALAEAEQRTSRTSRALLQALPAVDSALEDSGFDRSERTFLLRAVLIDPYFVEFVAGPYDAKLDAKAVAESLSKTPFAKLVEQRRLTRDHGTPVDPFPGLTGANRMTAARRAGGNK